MGGICMQEERGFEEGKFYDLERVEEKVQVCLKYSEWVSLLEVEGLGRRFGGKFF